MNRSCLLTHRCSSWEEEDKLSSSPLTRRNGKAHALFLREGWWTGECQGKYGLFPGAFVELLDDATFIDAEALNADPQGGDGEPNGQGEASENSSSSTLVTSLLSRCPSWTLALVPITTSLATIHAWPVHFGRARSCPRRTGLEILLKTRSRMRKWTRNRASLISSLSLNPEPKQRDNRKPHLPSHLKALMRRTDPAWRTDLVLPPQSQTVLQRRGRQKVHAHPIPNETRSLGDWHLNLLTLEPTKPVYPM